MFEARQDRIRDNLRRLSAIHDAMMSVLEESSAILQAELEELSKSSQVAPCSHKSEENPDTPVIDRNRMCVVYRGQRCFLGNTLKFKLLERLLRRRNQYVSYDDLMDEVWDAIRARSTVRSLVRELREKLRDAGMLSLSDAIVGQVNKHYGLFLRSGK